METYIRYKRICDFVTEQELDEIFRGIVTSGSEIIYYNENEPQWVLTHDAENNEIKILKIQVTIITGKKQSNTL